MPRQVRSTSADTSPERQASPARRDFLVGSAVAAAALTAPALSRAAGHVHTSDPLTAAVLAATADCVTEGTRCDQHCFERFTTGDAELADCARLVRELVTICTATHALGVQGAPRFAAMVELCAETCWACEKECRRHAAKHEACARCAEACAQALKAAAAFGTGRA